MKRTFTNVTFAIVASIIFSQSALLADEVESFTEPYRRVAVSAAEVGVLSEIRVVEGDKVKQGQVLAKLDDSVLVASLEVARAAKQAEGSLKAAIAENDARLKILESYKELRDQGNASPRECERAINEHLKSSARLLAVREELDVRRLEYERARVQIEQRKIKSPISGYVIQVEKEAGEFVSPTDPVVMHIVQLDSLKAVFSVPIEAARGISVGATVQLTVGIKNAKCVGKVEFVSPVADPQSGSIRIKVRILNQNGRIQSGAACYWELADYDSDERVTHHSSNPSSRTR